MCFARAYCDKLQSPVGPLLAGDQYLNAPNRDDLNTSRLINVSRITQVPFGTHPIHSGYGKFKGKSITVVLTAELYTCADHCIAQPVLTAHGGCVLESVTLPTKSLASE